MARRRGLEIVKGLFAPRSRAAAASAPLGAVGVLPYVGPAEIPGRLGAALLAATRLERSAPPDRLELVELESAAEFERYARDAAAVIRSRAALERLLAMPQAPFGCLGYDACVGEVVEFEVDLKYATARDEDGLLLPNYRERLLSPRTGLNSRQRATVLVLRRLVAGRDPGTLALYATEAVTPLFTWLKREYPAAVGSEYLGGAVPLGAARDGIRNEDVTRLTFADASLDVVVSCDVLEHVPEYESAFRELRRVLRPGGSLLASVPFLLDRSAHLIRARMTASGEVEHLEPPEHHGDPVNPEAGVLCFQQFGWNLLDDLRGAGFRKASALLVWSYYHGILGSNQVLFHATA